MTEFRINIKAKEFTKKLKKILLKRMKAVAIHLEASTKKIIGISNQGGRSPSRPGQPPRAGLGTLRKSITHSVTTEGKDIVATFGVARGPASAYARRLELGFTGRDDAGRIYNQAPRPYLRPTYLNNRVRILKILAG